MTIKEVYDAGGANYAWGMVHCGDCQKRHGGRTVLEIDKGKYDQVEFSAAKIDLLREAAKKHDNAYNGEHNVRILVNEQ